MRINQIITLACTLFISTSVMGQEQREISNEIGLDLSVFPAVSADQKQVVINLPAKESQAAEKKYKVELIAGKTMAVDCNKYGLNGLLQEKTVDSMGYIYYTFSTNGETWSTMMGCPEESRHEEFVSAQPLMIDYNSQIPIVIYLPEGYELRYTIWTAGEMIDPEKPSYTLCSDSINPLYQTWEWVISEGGFAGGPAKLEHIGLSKVYTFRRDGTYLQYKDSEMIEGGQFKLSNEVSIFTKGKLPMITLDETETKMSYTIEDNKLILSEECYDCYKHTYILKNDTPSVSKIRDCPDSIIENRMPRITNPESNAQPAPSTYYIYKGKRREVSEFDTEWVKKNCNVRPQKVF